MRYLILFVAAALCTHAARAQERSLKPFAATDTALLAAAGLNSVTVPRARGSADATVVEETRTRLTLDLRLSALPSIVRKLTVLALDGSNKPVAVIAPVSADLTGSPEATLEGLTLELSPDAPPGTVATERLLVYAVSGSGRSLGLLAALSCTKTWLKSPATLLATPLGDLPAQAATVAALDPKLVGKYAKLQKLIASGKLRPGEAEKMEAELKFLQKGREAPATRAVAPRAAPIPRSLQRTVLARAGEETPSPAKLEDDPEYPKASAYIDRYLEKTPPAEHLGKLFELVRKINLSPDRDRPNLIFLLRVIYQRIDILKDSSPYYKPQVEELERILANTPDDEKIATVEKLRLAHAMRFGKSKEFFMALSPEEKANFRLLQLIYTSKIEKLNVEKSKIKPVDASKGVPEESKDIGAKGPGTARFELENVVEVNYRALSDRGQALSIAPFVFHDANPASGVYYYLPARYILDFRPETGFGLKLYYDQAGAADPVRITLDLKAALNPDDIVIAEEIVRAACTQNNLPFRRLEPYRFSGVSFKLEAALAANLGISPQKIFVQGYAENGTIRAVIGATPSAKDLFWNLLTKGGVRGAAVEYASAADPNVKVQVPVEIKLPDRTSFGVQSLGAGGISRNATPFPVSLKYVHVMNFLGGKPWIFTFGLPDNELAAGGEVTIDRSRIPAWLSGGKLSKTWIEYELVPTLSGLQAAENLATSQSLGASTAEFSVEKTGAWPAEVAHVSVSLSSLYFSPTGAAEQTKAIVLTAADETKKQGTVYLRGRQEGVDMGAAKPLVRYVLTATYKNGTTKKGSAQTSNYLTIPVGADQLPR